MLIACSDCHRQYDVGDYEAGTRVRCFCGTLNKVPKPRARQVPMQHCSNCGGAIVGASEDCEFCDAKITLAGRGWGDSCPECMARMVKGARFCGACGIAIQIQATVRPLAGRPCPRCKHELSLCSDDKNKYAFTECTGCGGVWLSTQNFTGMLEEFQRHSVADIVEPLAKVNLGSLPPLEEHPVKYLPCPECTERMNRKNFAGISGIMIDSCRLHGHWFDLHELEYIQRFVDGGGLDKARRRQARQHKRQLESKKRGSGDTIAGPVLGRGSPIAGNGNWIVEFFLWDLLAGIAASIFD